LPGQFRVGVVERNDIMKNEEKIMNKNNFVSFDTYLSFGDQL